MQIVKCKLQICLAATPTRRAGCPLDAAERAALRERNGSVAAPGGARASGSCCVTRSDRRPCRTKSVRTLAPRSRVSPKLAPHRASAHLRNTAGRFDTRRSGAGNYEKSRAKMRRIIGGPRASSQSRLRSLACAAIAWRIRSCRRISREGARGDHWGRMNDEG